MSQIKTSEKLIHKIYRRNFTDLGMFFYVMGQRDIVPAMSVEKAMYNYFKSIGEEDFNIESSMTTFCRLQKEFYQIKKNETTS
jgi:acyl CoA:acetate/3-ketoacid CoA transferase alpha subunit